jgi:hypothetical protein
MPRIVPDRLSTGMPAGAGSLLKNGGRFARGQRPPWTFDLDM